MLFWTLYNSLQDDWLIDPKIHQPYQSLSHLYESSDAFSLSNSSHHLNFIGWNFVGLDFVGLQNRKSNHRLIFQFTFWWETHFCFEKIIIIVIVVSARPSGWLTSRLRRSAWKWEVMIFCDTHTNRQTLHHNIYIVSIVHSLNQNRKRRRWSDATDQYWNPNIISRSNFRSFSHSFVATLSAMIWFVQK